jgi:hypothetical protein
MTSKNVDCLIFIFLFLVYFILVGIIPLGTMH